MKVIKYHEKNRWYLLKYNNDYFLDVECNHSFFGFSVLIKLSDEENKHEEFIDYLANDIRNHTTTHYKNRDCSAEINQLSHQAIMENV